MKADEKYQEGSRARFVLLLEIGTIGIACTATTTVFGRDVQTHRSTDLGDAVSS